jgi:hypothetical protein
MPPPLDPRLVFDRLVIGAGNLLAATAARRVAESPGRSYNPLVVSGAPGVGKSHLLAAIGHLALAADPDLLVHAESADAFVDRVTASIADGTVDEMREASATGGLWLFDDFQALAGKTRSQQELVALWERALAHGTQLVVAVDRPVAELEGLDARLAARLDQGLTVELGPPDRATRLAIVRQLVAERGAPLGDGVVEAVAAPPIEDVRELQVALDRVAVAAESSGGVIDPSLVPALVGVEAPMGEAEGEFAGFLTDVSSAVAAVVETAPWRRELAEAILRWGGEGIRTRRLEEALDAESAPDVEGLLRGFAGDVARVRELARALSAPPADPALLLDPDRLPELEALAALATPGGGDAPARPAAGEEASPDPWFLSRARFAWDWVSLDERIIEEQR